MDSDLILVLKNGQIVERGRHEELLRMNGEYASMWHRQQESLAIELQIAQLQKQQSSLEQLLLNQESKEEGYLVNNEDSKPSEDGNIKQPLLQKSVMININ
eukprot:TRINITY_DN5473_c0_g1_i11.p1 TRINITY_DN5473_c0_g1~~TRINITY_DN5473_c0_g1_i11.p1  ORF type:complete len:101 (-),score=18.62 TRINITY_DN5473_c0_g1_i11:465-767(-)